MDPIRGLAIFYLITHAIRYLAQLMQEDDERAAGEKLERDIDALEGTVNACLTGCILPGCGLWIAITILCLIGHMITQAFGGR